MQVALDNSLSRSADPVESHERSEKAHHQQEMRAHHVLDRVQTKFPIVGDYGEPSFDVEKNTKKELAVSNQEML